MLLTGGLEAQLLEMVPSKGLIAVAAAQIGVRTDQYMDTVIDGLAARTESNGAFGVALQVAMADYLPPRSIDDQAALM